MITISLKREAKDDVQFSTRILRELDTRVWKTIKKTGRKAWEWASEAFEEKLSRDAKP